MFRPSEGFAHSESLAPANGGFAPSETIYPANGGFIPADTFMPFHGNNCPADTHSRFIDELHGSYPLRHPRDYVEELMLTDPMMLHHLASLVGHYLSLLNRSHGGGSTSRTGSSDAVPSRQQSRVSGSQRVEQTHAKQIERQRAPEISRETGNPSDLAAKLSNAGKRSAKELNTVGKCATGVQNALAKIGMPEFKGKFHGWQAREVLLNSGKFEEVPLSQIREGDIVSRKTSSNLRDANAKYGHVAIIGKDKSGKLMEYSDHARAFDAKHPRYSQTVVLRLKPQYA